MTHLGLFTNRLFYRWLIFAFSHFVSMTIRNIRKFGFFGCTLRFSKLQRENCRIAACSVRRRNLQIAAKSTPKSSNVSNGILYISAAPNCSVKNCILIRKVTFRFKTSNVSKRCSFWHAKGFKIWKKIQKLILDGHFKYSLFSLIKILITFMSHICYHVGRYKIRRRNCKFTQLWFIFYDS